MSGARLALAGWAAFVVIMFVVAVVHEAVERKRAGALWQWLTDAKYRELHGQVHPVAVMWRSVWGPPAVLLFLALVLLLLVQYGPAVAGRRWRDGP